MWPFHLIYSAVKPTTVSRFTSLVNWLSSTTSNHHHICDHRCQLPPLPPMSTLYSSSSIICTLFLIRFWLTTFSSSRSAPFTTNSSHLFHLGPLRTFSCCNLCSDRCIPLRIHHLLCSDRLLLSRLHRCTFYNPLTLLIWSFYPFWWAFCKNQMDIHSNQGSITSDLILILKFLCSNAFL